MRGPASKCELPITTESNLADFERIAAALLDLDKETFEKERDRYKKKSIGVQ